MVLTMGLAIHLFPILTEAGVSRDTAARPVGLSGIAGIVGKLVTGVRTGRVGANEAGAHQRQMERRGGGKGGEVVEREV